MKKQPKAFVVLTNQGNLGEWTESGSGVRIIFKKEYGEQYRQDFTKNGFVIPCEITYTLPTKKSKNGK